MKLLCIDNKGVERHLTIGKIYTLDQIDTFKHGSVIKNDMSFYDIYPMWRFKPLYEIRNKKIENILQDGTI
jgi:hypothetical protein